MHTAVIAQHLTPAEGPRFHFWVDGSPIRPQLNGLSVEESTWGSPSATRMKVLGELAAHPTVHELATLRVYDYDSDEEIDRGLIRSIKPHFAPDTVETFDIRTDGLAALLDGSYIPFERRPAEGMFQRLAFLWGTARGTRLSGDLTLVDDIGDTLAERVFDGVSLRQAIEETIQEADLDADYYVDHHGRLVVFLRGSVAPHGLVGDNVAGIPGVLAPGMIGSWWVYPRAMELAGRVFVGGTAPSGELVVSRLDLASGEEDQRVVLGPVFEADDHNTPAVLAYPDHPPVVFRSRHTKDTVVRYWTGSAVGSLAGMSGPHEVSFPGGGVAYSQVFREPGTDTLHLFAREDVDGDRPRLWSWRRHTAFGDTGTAWGPVRRVFDFGAGNQSYIRAVPTAADPDLLRVALIGNPVSSAVHDVYYCEIRLSTGDVKDQSGAVLGNLLTGAGLPIDVTAALDTAVSVPTDSARLFDVGDGPDPEIAYETWPGADGDATYKYAVYQGGSWSTDHVVAPAGKVFGYTAAAHYNGGMAFPRGSAGGEVVVSREQDGTWYLERMTTADGGATWSTAPIAQSGTALVRPDGLLGATDGDIVFHRLRDYGHYTEFDADTAVLSSAHSFAYGIAPQELKIDFDAKTYANRVFVNGATAEGSGFYQDEDAIAAAGGVVWTEVIDAPESTSKAQARNIARSYFSKIGRPVPRGEFRTMTPDDDWHAGQAVHVVKASFGVDANFPVVSVRRRLIVNDEDGDGLVWWVDVRFGGDRAGAAE